MNRRHFLGVGAALLSAMPRRTAAQQPSEPSSSSHLPNIVSQALTTPNLGFPVVTPLFAGVLVRGAAPAQLVRAESWDDFVTQAQQIAGSHTLSCFTSIQNMNQSWYYGAFQRGSANYFFFQTSSSNEFIATFTSRKSAYTLVDFNVSWQGGRLVYSGCWVAALNPTPQTLLLDIATGIDGLQSQASQFINAMQMTRVQSYPFNASGGEAFAALYQTGQGTGVVHDMPILAFVTEVEATLAQYTLAGLGYNPVSGNLTGTWQTLVAGANFFVDLPWDRLNAMMQQGSSSLGALAVYPDAPSFDDYFQENVAPYVMGYGYAVARHGRIMASGGGYATSPSEQSNPGYPYGPDTRMTLASVSKAITGVALQKLALQKGWQLNKQNFLPLLQNMNLQPTAPGVENITMQNLANMQSGLPPDDTPPGEGPADLPHGDTIWDVIGNYLENSPSNIGHTYYYDNTNFTILQEVIALQSGTDYVTYVNKNVLMPAGMDTLTISADPLTNDVPTTLIYSGPLDATPGYAWPEITLVGVSGWVSSARELVKLLMALRGSAVLPQSAVNEMFTQSIGWNLPGNPSPPQPPPTGPEPYAGAFGTYYWKEGGLHDNSGQSLETFLVRLGEGYDLALLINSPAPPVGIDQACFNAFDARGVSIQSPDGHALIQTVVHGASYLPLAAPGSYAAIIGSGFTDQPAADWTAEIASQGELPSELSGVRVRVGAVNAYVVHVSARRVNILLPASLASGMVDVELSTPKGVCTASLKVGSLAPGLFTHRIRGKNHAAAVFAASTEPIYVGPLGALPGESTRPARAGDIIQFYGSGMGPTNPLWPDGTAFGSPVPTADPSAFRASVDGIQAPVLYASMVRPGLFQINIEVPTGLSSGAKSVVVEVSGFASQPNVYVTIG
jgi:uncharacterized protein (TIGR03437 family)